MERKEGGREKILRARKMCDLKEILKNRLSRPQILVGKLFQM